MVPLGHYAPQLSIENVLDRFNSYLETAYAGSNDADLNEALKSRYQLALGNIAGVSYLKSRGELKPKPKKGDNAVVPVILILALIDELHLTLGGATTQ